MDVVKLRRWYDKSPKMAKAVGLLETFPEYFLEMILGAVAEIAERDCNALDKMASNKSIGAEKVMGLYKSKNKSRKADQSPQMHKIMNYLYILEEADRNALGDQIQALVLLVYDYLKLCTAQNNNISLNDVQTICTLFVQGGEAQANDYIKNLRIELLRPSKSLIVGRPEWVSHGDRLTH